MESSSSDGEWVLAGHAISFTHGSKRLQACIKGRYVTVLKIDGKLTCIDSICFHAGGPLGLGDIEDVNGHTCLICPWHKYKIDAFTGEKYYQSVTWKDGKMVPGEWKSNGPRHRIHQVEQRADGRIYVKLDSSSNEVASDAYACDKPCGDRILSTPDNAAGMAAAAVGADGTFPWLRRLQQQQQQQQQQQ